MRRISTFTHRFATALLAAILAQAPAAQAATVDCTVIVDQTTGAIITRQGECGTRFTPMSSFKLPLALMGFDAGILKDAHHPLWNYKEQYKAVKRARKPVDPAIWQADSIVWYSQELTRALGEAAFARYVESFGYGNADVSGLPGGESGLTHAWLTSSLKISPDEQVAFIRRILSGRLPVSAHARAMAMGIVPAFEGADGWEIHGKTGSGWVDATRARPLGWFVGWAKKGGRTIVFARLRIRTSKTGSPEGHALRDAFLKELSQRMEGG